MKVIADLRAAGVRSDFRPLKRQNDTLHHRKRRSLGIAVPPAPTFYLKPMMA
jgi:hypothetical protein